MEHVEEIKSYWTSRALNTNIADAKVTHSDFNQRLLEIDLLLQYLPRDGRILDVGCGNGYSTQIFSRYAREIVGIDYSEAMIQRARAELGPDKKNVRFEQQDVLNLNFPSASFDVAISQRCLINLVSWPEQKKALKNITDAIKPGGVFILQEGSQQGREGLNQARELCGLERMPLVPYNLDFNEQELWPFLRQYFEIVDVRKFGLYDLISRIVHPLLVEPSQPAYDAKINDVARRLATHMRGFDEVGREFSAFLRKLA